MERMRVADFVFDYLKKHGVDHVFMLSGGGIMYLVDALGRSKIEYVCCHHEQGAAIAAQAYGMYDDTLGVCLVTTGPGGTNALTATGAAYMDSTPMLFISGQVKRSDFASLRNVRQFGAQENDIISMAKPVTKYAVTVMRPEDVPYELEKCVYMATHGRKGPVWLDIPLDIQSAEIRPEELRNYIPEQKDVSKRISNEIRTTCRLLADAKRPLILAGHGVNAARAQDSLRMLVEQTGIPLLSTWRAMGLLGEDEKLYFGAPGLQAPRYSNLILQHCDFLLVLGSRLDNMITAFNEAHFAKMANVVIVDIDENELKKLHIQRLMTIHADVGSFVDELTVALKSIKLPDYTSWLSRCQIIKERFPLLKEKQIVSEGVDLYQVTFAISEYAKIDDTLVVSSTSRCNTAGHIAFKRERGQKCISSMGFGSMGFALPSAVGAYFAGDHRRTLVLEGDGSLQLNIQELETIVSNDINTKLFVFNNAGYAAITTMQDRNFDSFYVGSNEKSGVFMPDLKKISEAYDIPYCCIETNEDIQAGIRWAMEKVEGVCMVDIKGALSFDEIPKCISYVDAITGQRVSAALENPFPFLGDEEMKEIAAYLTGE